MKKLLLLYLFVCSVCMAWAADCPITIQMGADKSIVSIEEPEVFVHGDMIEGRGYYTWYKDGEVVADGTMSLGEFTIYYLDEEVADKPCTVRYTLTVSNSSCSASAHIDITVIDPTSASEASADKAITIIGRQILVNGSADNVLIYNLTGAVTSNPVPTAGVYLVNGSKVRVW